MKEAKKVQITETVCRQAQLMRRGGASQAQVAELLGINNSTVSRIEAAGFDFGKYTEMRRIRREKERKAKEPEVVLTIRSEELTKTDQAEEQVPGQIRMDLEPEKPEMSEQVKMMRFMAGQVDKLYMKLDAINDTLSMVLRTVRRE